MYVRDTGQVVSYTPSDDSSGGILSLDSWVSGKRTRKGYGEEGTPWQRERCLEGRVGDSLDRPEQHGSTAQLVHLYTHSRTNPPDNYCGENPIARINAGTSREPSREVPR